ncbi:hypothetical protein LOTGIDRAFT_129256, partial [Lottia gigantea]
DSCVGRCNKHLDNSFNCQCNYACSKYHDCCSDYNTECHGGNHNHITNHPGHTGSFSGIAQTLWDADIHRFGPADLKVNYQGHTARGPVYLTKCFSRFFTFVNEAKLNGPTYKAMLDLWDNYHTSESIRETSDAAYQTDVDAFLNTVLNTSVMQIANKYLVDNSKYPNHIAAGQVAFKSKLQELWFHRYSRKSGGITNSCGFEHIFLGEFKGSSVSGFHNWVRFHKLESSGRIDYKGYINKKEPFLVEFTFTWDGKWKPISSFFIGTSPEFDMALSTICILSEPNRACKFTLEGQDFRIQNYDIPHIHGLQVASAYPEV